MMRANMSVAIVCMTTDDKENNSIDYNVSASTPLDDCPYQNTEEKGSTRQGEFRWSRTLRGFILSSFYIGYVLTQAPAGWVSKKFGCKRLILAGVMSLSIATLLTPICARANVYLLVVLQILKGVASGLYYPALFQFWGFWAPPADRSTLAAISMAGAPIGALLSSIFSGLLCEHGFDGGWPSIFYSFGTFSLIWTIAWIFLGHESPSAHPRISPAEKEYIETSLDNVLEGIENKKLAVPWHHLSRSLPFYSLIMANFVYAWGWFTAQNVLPQYMKDVLKFNITANGLFNALPYLFNFAITILASFLADALITGSKLSITGVRKLLTTMALFPSAILVIVTAFLNCHHVPLAITCLSLSVGLFGCNRSGGIVNIIDLAPAYAGVITGIDLAVTCIPGIVAPYLTGVMTTEGKQEEWRNVFLLGAGLLILGWIVYLVFGNGDEQEWSKEARGAKSREVVINNCTLPDTEERMLQKMGDNDDFEPFEQNAYS